MKTRDTSVTRLVARLEHWKFADAAKLLPTGDNTYEAELIHALAGAFGNVGLFEGSLGDVLCTVVDILVVGVKRNARDARNARASHE